MTYEDAFNFRDAIRYMVETRQMPPFKQSKACQSMKDDPSLSAKEIETIGRWVSNGAPEGNPAEMPPAKSFPDIWTAGTPDLPLAMPQPFTPDFSNGDVYRCFVMPTSTTEDKWVTKVEVLPGARAMVHHVLLYLDTTNAAEELDARDPGPGQQRHAQLPDRRGIQFRDAHRPQTKTQARQHTRNQRRRARG